MNGARSACKKLTYHQRFIEADREVCQCREEKQLVEIFTRRDDEGEFQRGEGMELLLENCIHQTMRTVLFLVSRVVADEA